jgi:hypothetical protein
MSARTEVASRVELDRGRADGPSPPGTLGVRKDFGRNCEILNFEARVKRNS